MARNKLSKDYTVIVQSIHVEDCEKKSDAGYIRCNCPKQLVTTFKQERVIVQSKHREDCEKKSDAEYIWCNCPKQHCSTQDGAGVAAKTCDYKVAQAEAKKRMEYLDWLTDLDRSFDDVLDRHRPKELPKRVPKNVVKNL
jgi:hypothetical protein